MFLSVIIPHFSEDESMIKKLLDSIEFQHNIDLKNDVECIICSDGPDSKPLSDEFLKRYTYPITHLVSEKHLGVSEQRNIGLRNAKGDYVTFNDADDSWYHCLAFWFIKRETTTPMEVLVNGVPTTVNGFDALFSVFLEEGRDQQGNTYFIDRTQGMQFFHGKVARRQFLIDNDIWQDPDCYIHEDHLFAGKISACTNRIKWCNVPFYVWCWNPNSVCRRSPNYIKETYTDLIKSTDSLVEWYKKHLKFDNARQTVVQLVYDCYYNVICHPSWSEIGTAEYRQKAERRFAEFYIKHKQLWDECPDQVKMQISSGIRQRVVAEGMLQEKVTLYDFLERMRKLGENQ